MDKILVKEIDKYTSSIFESKTVSEYLIYVVSENGTNKEAYTEFGDRAKDERVSSLLKNKNLLTIE